MPARILGFVVAFFCAFPCHARKLRLHPLTIIEVNSKTLEISTALECGMSFYGLLTQEEAIGSLRVAAVVESNDLNCSGLKSPLSIKINYLNLAKISVIRPLAVDSLTSAHLVLDSISSVHTSPSNHSGVTLVEASYEPKCLTPLGTILRQESAQVLALGIAEYTKSLGKKRTCPTRVEKSSLSYLKPRMGMTIQGLEHSSGKHPKRQYLLRLAAIEKDSVSSLGQHGGIGVRFERACNEAPIGMVLRGSRHRPELGVVVAQFLNFHCQNDAMPVWDELKNDDLTIENLKNLQLLSGERIEALRLEGPAARYSREKNGLAIHHLPRCQKPLGVLYSHDSVGHLAFGLVSEDKASSCISKVGEVSLMQPFLGQHVVTQDLTPLKLKG